MNRLIGSILGIGFVASAPVVFAAAVKLEPEQIEFFEKKVRPVLAEHCYKCHSTQPEAKIKGDLRLDNREAMLKGGQSGPAVVPGKPEKSLFLAAIKHLDPDTAMPPKEDKLSDAIIANLEQWVRMGAPDPREATDKKIGAVDFEKAKEHWAFKPVANPPAPKVSDRKGFVQSPIDAFVLAKLTEKGLAPSAKADKATLIRRVAYDLTGLPPSADEVEAFVKDNSKDAYAKLVDRLLASRHFGEHWGRLWLDIARYADTTGDRQNGGRRNPLLPYAWTYRDYVIESFNKDLPYDQFIIQQIAGDRLPEAAQDKSLLRALGFITVGKTFMGNENETIDDRIDVITKGLMAFTVSCARCHDHKFDPVTAKDYYGLHGVFVSSRQPEDLPLIAEPKKTPEYQDFLAKMEEVDERVEDYHEYEFTRIKAGMFHQTGDFLLAVREATQTGRSSSGNFRLVARKYGLESAVFELWSDTLRDIRKNHANDPIFAPWLALSALPDQGFSAKAKEIIAKLGKETPAHPLIAQGLRQKAPSSIKDVAVVYTSVFDQVSKAIKTEPFTLRGNQGRTRFEIKKSYVTSLEDRNLESIRMAFFGEKPMVDVDERVMGRLVGVQFRNAENTIRSTQYGLQMSHPGSPLRAMVLQDSPNPRDSRIMIRGEPRNLGDRAPRQFIQILAKNPEPFKDGSGRLELARAIATRDNPMTPRVWANRVWKNLFGEAIVRTPSDFGVRSDTPTHPEMLDHLASYLMDNGWSTKKLIRSIVLSSTYQQDSKSNDKAMKVDPTNQLLWRMNIRRLSFEEIRDTLLNAGGTLDLTMGGQPIRLETEGRSAGGRQYNFNVDLKVAPRRTIYGMVDRGALPEVYRTFDFANPDMSTGERILTTVPQQALFMMNSPFVADTVRHVLAREDFKAQKTPEDKIKFLYRLAYQRAPSDKELKLSMDFLAKQLGEEKPPVIEVDKKIDLKALEKTDRDARREAYRQMQAQSSRSGGGSSAKLLDAWERYTQVVLLSNEFVFLN